MLKVMKFKKYMMQFLDDDTPLGDLARDMKDDKCGHGNMSVGAWRKHIKSHTSDVHVCRTLSMAEQMYRNAVETK